MWNQSLICQILKSNLVCENLIFKISWIFVSIQQIESCSEKIDSNRKSLDALFEIKYQMMTI